MTITAQLEFEFAYFAAAIQHFSHYVTGLYPNYRTPPGTTIRGQSGPGSNDNKEILHIPQGYRTEASASYAVDCHTQDTTSIWPIDGTRTGTTTPGHSGPGSNGIESVFHILQSSRTGASLSNGLMSYLGHTHWRGLIALK